MVGRVGDVPSAFGRPWQAEAQGQARPSFSSALRRATARQAADEVEPTLVGDVDPGRLPGGRAGVAWAARELESELWMWLLQDALSSGGGAGLFGPGFAGSVYQEWLARALAEEMVRAGAGELAEALTEQLAPESGTVSGKAR